MSSIMYRIIIGVYTQQIMKDDNFILGIKEESREWRWIANDPCGLLMKNVICKILLFTIKLSNSIVFNQVSGILKIILTECTIISIYHYYTDNYIDTIPLKRLI